VDRFADVLSLIVVTAMVGVIVGSPNTRGQIDALTGGFSNVLRAATGAGQTRARR
jgi:hypothetical protein